MVRKDPNDPRDRTAGELRLGRELEETKKDLNFRQAELKDILRKTYQLVNQLLITLNAGGAVACLAYIGSAGHDGVSPWIVYSLLAFCAGTVVLITMTIIFLFDVLRTNNGWDKNIKEFMGDELGIRTLWKEDANRGVMWPVYVGIVGGFLIFIIGVFLGVAALIAK